MAIWAPKQVDQKGPCLSLIPVDFLSCKCCTCALVLVPLCIFRSSGVSTICNYRYLDISLLMLVCALVLESGLLFLLLLDALQESLIPSTTKYAEIFVWALKSWLFARQYWHFVTLMKWLSPSWWLIAFQLIKMFQCIIIDAKLNSWLKCFLSLLTYLFSLTGS